MFSSQKTQRGIFFASVCVSCFPCKKYYNSFFTEKHITDGMQKNYNAFDSPPSLEPMAPQTPNGD